MKVIALILFVISSVQVTGAVVDYKKDQQRIEASKAQQAADKQVRECKEAFTVQNLRKYGMDISKEANAACGK